MEAFVTAGAGFLLAVLWFDLMHDVMVRGHDARPELPDDVLSGVTTYYARVTTGASPMNRLVAVAMVGTLAGILAELTSGYGPKWVGVLSLLLAASAILLAGAKTVPNAVRLGSRVDDAAAQSRLARAIYRDHLFCFACMSSVLVLQLGAAAT